MKYGQEGIFNLWQMGTSSLLRLMMLSFTLGGLATIIWWRMNAPEYSFYYLFQYCYSWLYCRIPFGCSQVAQSNLQILQPFIDRLGELIRNGGMVFTLVSVGSAIGLRIFFVWYTDNLEKVRFLRGARLLKARELNAETATCRSPQGKLKYKPTALDLYLGREKVRLPYSLTFRHIGLIGISGTGKTQLINNVLQQLGTMSGQKCLILDLNGQYYARFGQEGDKVLSLYDTRSEAWSFYGENVPPEFLADALVEVTEGGSGQFFGKAGRALLSDVISRNTKSEDIWLDLTSPTEQLLSKLQGGSSPALLGASEQAAGVLATAMVELGFLRHLNHWNDSQDFFSLSQWVLSPSQDWVFLIVKDVDLAATKPLMRLWVDLVVGGVLQRDENKQYPHLWLVCDELPGLGLLPSLGKLLSQGRKYKSSLIAGYQVRGQIEKLYGKEGAREIIAGLQNRIIFRIPEPNDAKDESLTLGEQEVEEVTASTQLGEGVMEGDRNSLQQTIKTRPVVMASQLQNLADLKAYVKICDLNPCLISFDYQFMPEVNEPSRRYVPAAKTQNLSNHNPEALPETPEAEGEEGEETCQKQQADEDELQWDINPDTPSLSE